MRGRRPSRRRAVGGEDRAFFFRLPALVRSGFCPKSCAIFRPVAEPSRHTRLFSSARKETFFLSGFNVGSDSSCPSAAPLILETAFNAKAEKSWFVGIGAFHGRRLRFGVLELAATALLGHSLLNFRHSGALRPGAAQKPRRRRRARWLVFLAHVRKLLLQRFGLDLDESIPGGFCWVFQRVALALQSASQFPHGVDEPDGCLQRSPQPLEGRVVGRAPIVAPASQFALRAKLA